MGLVLENSVWKLQADETLWVLDLSTNYSNLKTSRPAGMNIAEPVSNSIDDAVIHGGELIIAMGTNEGAPFNGTGGYTAPRAEFKATRGLEETLVIRGKFRNRQTGGGSFPGVGLFISKDADEPGADRAWLNSRTNGTSAFFWNNANVQTGKTITTGQRDTTGVWVRFIVGAMGGLQGFYSVDTTSDPDSVSWTEWDYGATSGAWYFTESEGGPQQPLRFGLAVGMQTSNSTNQEGVLMYLDSNIRPTGA